MRILVIILCLSIPCFLLKAEDLILSNQELVTKISVGTGSSEVYYHGTDEVFYSPRSPLVTKERSIIFFPRNNPEMTKVFANGTLKSLQIESDFTNEINSSFFSSQQGLSIELSGVEIIYNNGDTFSYNYSKKLGSPFRYDFHIPAPFGAILYSDKQKQGIAVVFNVENPSPDFEVIGPIQFPSWLVKQPGGFSIGSDGHLYRNGFLWSAILPKAPAHAERYVGKLMSGHSIWVEDGISGYPKYLTISNSIQEVELTVNLGWASEENTDGPYTKFDYGIGPWGELYALIAPPWKKGARYYEPEPGVPAELVVVRNHLKYFGRLNDGGVRLRKDPSTSGEILGTYPNKTGFRILEKGTKEETIGGQKNVWYKVRLLDGKEGWFFGSFVHNLYDGPNGNPPPWPNVPDW